MVNFVNSAFSNDQSELFDPSSTSFSGGDGSNLPATGSEAEQSLPMAALDVAMPTKLQGERHEEFEEIKQPPRKRRRVVEGPSGVVSEEPKKPRKKRRKVEVLSAPSGVDESIQTLLSSSSPLAPDAPLRGYTQFLGHILGEDFIAGTEFTGMQSFDAVTAMKNSLSSLRAFISNFEEENVLQKRVPLLHKEQVWKFLLDVEIIFESTLFCQGRESFFPGMKSKIKDAVLQLQKAMEDRLQILHETGMPFLIAGGWIGNPGHTLYYLVSKDESAGAVDDYRSMKCCLQIFNLGAGVEKYHPALQDRVEKKYFPYVVTNDIPAINFLNKFFLEALVTINNIAVSRSVFTAASNEYDAVDMYESIVSVLGGTCVLPDTIPEESYVSAQKAGICSIAGLMQVIKFYFDSFDKESYVLFRHYCELQTLSGIKNVTLCNEQEQNLFRLCIEKFARNCHARKDFLSLHERTLSLSMCESLLQQVEKMANQYTLLQRVTMDASLKPDCVFLHNEEPYSCLEQARPVAPLGRGVTVISDSVEVLQKFRDPLQFSKDVFVSLSQLDVSWKNRSVDSIQSVNCFFSNCRAFEGDLELQVQTLTFFIENIHCPGDAFWGNIPRDHIPACMEAFSFCTNFLVNKYRCISKEIPEANLRLYLMKLTSIQHRLLAESNIIPNFSKNYRVMADNVLFGEQEEAPSVCASKDSYLSLSSQKLQKQYGLIHEYIYSHWKEKTTLMPRYAIQAMEIVSERTSGCLWENLLEELFMANEIVYKKVPQELISPRAAMYSCALSDMQAKYMPIEFVAWHTQLISAYVFIGLLNGTIEFKMPVEFLPEFLAIRARRSSDRLLQNANRNITLKMPGVKQEEKISFEKLVREKALGVRLVSGNYLRGYSQNHVLSNLEKSFRDLSEIEREFVFAVTNEALFVPSLFLEKLVAFCAAQPEALNELCFQKMTYEMITSPQLLLRASKENFALQAIVYRVLQDGVAFAIKCRQISAGCFYAGLLHFANTTFGKKDELLSAKKIVRELLGLCKNTTEKSLCARHLILVCGETQEVCSADDLMDFLDAYVYLVNHPLEEDFRWLTLDFAVQDIRREFDPFLRSLILSERGAMILSNTINLIFEQTGMVEDAVWDCSKYPLCNSSNGFSLDIFTGVASRAGVRFGPITSSIRQLVKKIFPSIDMPLPSSVHADGVFFDSDRVEIRREPASHDPSLDLITARRKVDGKWCHLQVSFRNPAVVSFTGRIMIWLNKEAKELLFFSKTDGELCARAPIKTRKKKVQLCDISDCKNDFILVPIDEQVKNRYACLGKIELFTNISIWRELSGRHRRIELLKKGLSCEIERVDEVDKIFISHPHRFFVSSTQKIDTISFIENYLVLENDFGYKKVLIPFLEIDAAYALKNPLVQNAKLDFGRENTELFSYQGDDTAKKEERPAYVLFDVTKGGELVGCCRSHDLFLAYILFAAKRGRESIEIMRKQYERPFKADVVDALVFSWFYDLMLKQFSSLPEVYSVSLLSFLLYIRTRSVSLSNQVWPVEKVAATYEKYLEFHDELGECTLAPHEELEIIEWILHRNTNNSVPILFRKHELKKKQVLFQVPVRENQVVRTQLDGPVSDYFRSVKTLPRFKNILRSGDVVSGNFKLVHDKLSREEVRFTVLLSKNDCRNDPYFIEILRGILDGSDISKKISFGTETTPARWPKIQITKTIFNRETYASSLFKPRLLPSHNGATMLGEGPRRASLAPFKPLEDIFLLTVEEKMQLFEAISSIDCIMDRKQLSPYLVNLRKIGSESKYNKNFEDLVFRIFSGNALPEGRGMILRKNIPVETLKRLLLEKKGAQDSIVEEALREVLRFANAPQGDLEQVFDRTAQVAGRILSPVNEEDLLLFFAFQDTKFILRKQRWMSDQTLSELNQKVFNYLIQATHKQQIDRGLSHIERFGHTPDCDDIEDGLLRENLAVELLTRRAYSPHETPLYLVFEFLNDLLLRKSQVACLDKVSGNENAAFQMNMGAGKTKVILPLAALGKAQKGKLPIIIVPKPLFKTVYADMHNQITEKFGVPVGAIRFTRHSDYSALAMTKLLAELRRIKEASGCVILTARSVSSFVLAFELKLIGGKKEDETAIEVMKNILKFFKEEGHALVDEVDVILNSRHETNFALGEPTPMRQGNLDCVADIFQFLASYFGDKEVFADSSSFEEIKNQIMRKCLDKQLKRIFEVYKIGFSEYEGDLIFQFINGKSDLDESVSWRMPQEVLQIFSVLRGEFSEILPLTLSKRCNIAYGFSPIPSKEIAIPYAANDTPIKGSEFGNPYEVLNYTMQTFLNSDVDSRRFENSVIHLQNKVRADRLSGIPIDQLASFQTLSYFAGTPHIDLSDKMLYEVVARHLGKNKQLLIEFVRTVIFPLVAEYNQKISMTAPGLVDVFACFQGFSGTPWNASTYPRSMRIYADSKSEGAQIVHLLNLNPTLVPLPSDSPSDVFAWIQSNLRESHRAFIDSGAFFRGLTNEFVARRLLEILPPSIDSVAFYSGNTLMVLRRDHDAIIPFEEDFHVGHRFTYYDQKHTTGADIVQLGSAEAFVSVSNDVMLRDLLQSIWRMRGIAKGQKIELLLSPSMVTSVRKISPDELTIVGVLGVSASTQFCQLQEHETLSVSQKAQQCLKKNLLQSVLYDAGQKNVSQQASACFIHVTKDDPYATYGKIESPVSKEEYIDSKIAETMARMPDDTIWGHRLRSDLEKSLYEVSLPDVVYISQSSESSTYEQEVETSKELHMHVATNASVLNPEQKTQYPPQVLEDYICDPWIHFSLERRCDVAPLSLPVLQVFEANELLSPELSGIFDPFLKISRNIFPAGEGRSPFDIHQPSVQYLLVSQIEGILHTRILSLDENTWFYKRLRQNPVIGNVPIGIYDLHLRSFILMAGDTLINLENNPYFAKLCVQAKFFDGQVSYSDQEIKELEEWIRFIGAEKLKKAFLYIIRANLQKQSDFNRSILKRLLG